MAGSETNLPTAPPSTARPFTWADARQMAIAERDALLMRVRALEKQFDIGRSQNAVATYPQVLTLKPSLVRD